VSGRRTLWGEGYSEPLPFLAELEAEDRTADLVLLPEDARATAAHACVLARLGALAPEERRAAAAVLRGIVRRTPERLPDDVEDGPTWLEARLAETLGPTGERIHLGRSRNDQAATALRLHERRALLDLHERAQAAARAFLDWGERYAALRLPGYTHGRTAMPSSFRQWALAQAAPLLDALEALEGVDRRLDRSPLGAAAGFGSPLPLDRDYAARLLGFGRAALAPADAVGGDRLRGAVALLEAAAVAATGLESTLADLLLWSGESMGFVRLGDVLTTGSSLMPQKRNPDVLELARARARRLRAAPSLTLTLAGGLPGGYQRDLQLTKPVLLGALADARALLDLVPVVLAHTRPDGEAASRALGPETGAARAACLRAWREGRPFRTVYREVRTELASGGFRAPGPEDDPGEALGGPREPGLERWHAALEAHRLWAEARRAARDEADRFLWTECGLHD
jgi:argininosuccinate lyase